MNSGEWDMICDVQNKAHPKDTTSIISLVLTTYTFWLRYSDLTRFQYRDNVGGR